MRRKRLEGIEPGSDIDLAYPKCHHPKLKDVTSADGRIHYGYQCARCNAVMKERPGTKAKRMKVTP